MGLLERLYLAVHRRVVCYTSDLDHAGSEGRAETVDEEDDFDCAGLRRPHGGDDDPPKGSRFQKVPSCLFRTGQ